MSSFIEVIQNFIVATAATVASVFPTSNYNGQNNSDVKYETSLYEATRSATTSEHFTASGKYSYLNQSVSYSLNVPKGGGEIKGNFSGFCLGTLSGSYNGNVDGSVNGIVKGRCKLAFIEQDILGHFSGNINGNNNNKLNIDWVNDGNYGPKQGSINLDLKSDN